MQKINSVCGTIANNRFQWEDNNYLETVLSIIVEDLEPLLARLII